MSILIWNDWFKLIFNCNETENLQQLLCWIYFIFVICEVSWQQKGNVEHEILRQANFYSPEIDLAKDVFSWNSNFS